MSVINDFILANHKSMSSSQIAEHFGIPVANVHSHAKTLKIKLKSNADLTKNDHPAKIIPDYTSLNRC